jgi:hypothetical protein
MRWLPHWRLLRPLQLFSIYPMTRKRNILRGTESPSR